jgi:hypothetical protein
MQRRTNAADTRRTTAIRVSAHRQRRCTEIAAEGNALDLNTCDQARQQDVGIDLTNGEAG